MRVKQPRATHLIRGNSTPQGFTMIELLVVIASTPWLLK
jgi:type II secretory pathway pseudopilin PulG